MSWKSWKKQEKIEWKRYTYLYFLLLHFSTWYENVHSIFVCVNFLQVKNLVEIAILHISKFSSHISSQKVVIDVNNWSWLYHPYPLNCSPLSNSDILKVYNNLFLCSKTMHKWSFSTKFMNLFSMLISQNMHLHKERCNLIGWLHCRFHIFCAKWIRLLLFCYFSSGIIPCNVLGNKYWKITEN